MKVMQALKEAALNVSRSKLRTLLTMLGLVVGISSVIALVGLGEGSNKEVEEQMEALGGDIITTYLFEASLSYDDIKELRENPMLSNVAPSKTIAAKVGTGKKQSNRGLVEATDENYLETRNLKLESGRNLSSVDRANRSKVCVVGASVAKDLFGSSDVIGKSIKIEGDEFTIVGILEQQGESIGMPTGDLVMIPYTLIHEFGAEDKIDTLYARAADKNNVPLAKMALTQFLSTDKQIPSSRFMVNSQDEMLNAESSINETMTLMMAGIASISLIVAGIGVMNVMLVSVTERIREIGIKKALGARRTDILSQFLFEALAISLAGGVCGIAVGLLFGLAADSIGLRFEASLSVIMVAVGASVLVGLVFGIFPAYRASRLNPIDALRQE